MCGSGGGFEPIVIIIIIIDIYPRSSTHPKVVLGRSCIRSNWNLEMLVFEERGKPENLDKNISEQSREPTTNFTHSWPEGGHVGGRHVQSPLHHPCSPKLKLSEQNMKISLSLFLKTPETFQAHFG